MPKTSCFISQSASQPASQPASRGPIVSKTSLFGLNFESVCSLKRICISSGQCLNLAAETELHSDLARQKNTSSALRNISISSEPTMIYCTSIFVFVFIRARAV